ncbi:MAG: antiporter [Alphaproteobacteria bacterium]
MAKDLYGWNPEDKGFWEESGKKIANRNLWLSIPCLLCAFATWMYWSVITVQMLNLGFDFQQADLFSLMSISGLAGATLRIPSTFFIRIAGGRNTLFLTTALLIIPALLTGLGLQNPNTPLWQFQFYALLSGIGGGNFASSMSNISFFYPKKAQGYALGMNAGLGNFGVTAMQLLVPLVMTFAVVGSSRTLQIPSGTLIGKIPAGTELWIQNGGYVWVAVLIPLIILTWFGTNNIRDENVSPNIGSTASSFAKIIGMLLIGMFTSALGLWLMLPKTANGAGIGLSMWIVVPLVIAVTVGLLRLLPGSIGSSLGRQYQIFKNKHTWVMTIIYTMTFGSFIGFSAAFGLSIKVIFGFQHVLTDGVWDHSITNPNAPSALTYVWMGAFIGSLIRPVGGILADKIGGARVTQIISFTMVGSALGVAYFMKLAYTSTTPEVYFVPFLLLFLLLFCATGLGNGSTFRSIANIFERKERGPVLGWSSAVAAYGAFIVPQLFGEQIHKGTPEYAIYGLAVFYVFCIGLNWWFYMRPGAEIRNP